MEQKRGGIRTGAGRKPTDNPKQAITIYVEKKKIWLFGNEGKLKDELYGFINSREMNEIAPKEAHKSYLPPITHDEPLSFDKLKDEAVKKISQYDAYCNEINAATVLSLFPPIAKEIENDPSLTPQQKSKLKLIAVERSKEFDF